MRITDNRGERWTNVAETNMFWPRMGRLLAELLSARGKASAVTLENTK
jgi:hypothetical protein